MKHSPDFKALVEANPDWIWQIDCNGVIIYSNTTVSELLGYKPAEIIGVNILELIHPKCANRNRFTSDYLHTLETIKPTEQVLQHKTHKRILLESEGKAFFDKSGLLAGFHLRSRNISRRVKMRQQLTSIQQLAHLGVWELDLLTNEQQWSDGIYHLLGEAPQSFDPNFENFMRFLPDEDKRKVQEGMQRAFEHQEEYDLFHNIRHNDGTLRNVHARANVIFENEKPVKMIGSVIDITETVLLQHQLQTTLHLLQSVINNVENLIFYKDTQFRYLGCNHAFERFMGHTQDELIGHEDFEFFPEEVAQHFRALDQKIFDTQERVINPQWVEYPDGSKVFLHTITTPLYDHLGKLIGLVGNSIDLTKEKLLSEQLEHQAKYDSLTEIPNRTLFLDRLEQSLKDAHRRKCKVAVLFMDLDGFKTINDTLGHRYGDQVLKHVATRLRDSFRNNDTVARLGGDEFAAIVSDIQDDSAVITLAEKMLHKMSHPIAIENYLLSVTISIGITVFPEHASHSDELLTLADNAMYMAKSKGKNCYVIYQSSEHTPSSACTPYRSK